MKIRLIFVLCLHCIVSGSQSTRYREKLFTEVQITSDILYGVNVDRKNIPFNLLMDVYEPKGDTLSMRPCIVLVHGGVFMTGDKLDPVIVALCREFALRGYVTASIEYRIGTDLSFRGFAEAILRAVQDAKAAVRFLRGNKKTYRIDEAKFALGGTSAGGVTAVHYAYMDSEEIPSEVDTAALGGIEGESGTPGISSTINCIINCWGAIGDTLFIQQDEQIPVISFHGTDDKVVPYDAGFALNLPSLPLYGSAAIDRQCRRLGIISELHSYIGMGHGHGVDARLDTTVSLLSDFLYSHLIENTAVATFAVPKDNSKKTSNRLLVFTRDATFNTFNLQKKTSGMVYSVDGKRLHVLNMNIRGNPSGCYVVDKMVFP